MIRMLLSMWCLVLMQSALAAAPPVKPNPAAAGDAQSAFLPSSEPERSKILAKARQTLEAGALRAPQEQRIAQVLLTRGLTGAGIEALLAPRHMELVSFEAKVPVPGPPNHFVTLWLGSRKLMFRKDSIEDLVDRAIGHERYQFLLMAQRESKDPENQSIAAEYRAAGMSPELGVYRIEVMGTRTALFSLLRETTVFAVLVIEDEKRVAAFHQELAEFKQAVVFRGPPIIGGRIDPDGPLPELPDFPEFALPQGAAQTATGRALSRFPHRSLLGKTRSSILRGLHSAVA